MSLWDFNLISVFAFIFSVIAVWVSYASFKSASESLSLNAFMRAIEMYGELSIRKKRKHIFDNVPDSLLAQAQEYPENIPDIPNKLKLFIIDGKNNPIEKKIWPENLDPMEQEYFEEISVRLDRIGFFLLNLDLSKDFKQKYYSWMCVSIIEMWNRLAPYIMKQRMKRGKYVPYFEELIVKLWPYYKKEVKNSIIFVFKPKIRYFS